MSRCLSFSLCVCISVCSIEVRICAALIPSLGDVDEVVVVVGEALPFFLCFSVCFCLFFTQRPPSLSLPGPTLLGIRSSLRSHTAVEPG